MKQRLFVLALLGLGLIGVGNMATAGINDPVDPITPFNTDTNLDLGCPGGDDPCGGTDEVANGAPDGCGGCGMPIWWVSEPYLSLWVTDVPLFYRTSRGSHMALRLSHKQQGKLKDGKFSSFGGYWESPWLEELKITQSGGGAPVIDRHRGGGGIVPMPAAGTADYLTRATMVGVNQMKSPSGRTREYNYIQAISSTVTNRFLTKIYDNAGLLEREYTYETVSPGGTPIVRLTSVKDPDGKAVTLAYENSSYPFLITKATDPYGRYAVFSYDSGGQLESITDMGGLTSYIYYDGDGSISTLYTPYGYTSFTYYTASTTTDRAILINEPNGESQLYASRFNGMKGTTSVAGSYATLDPEPHQRNTFHWNRQQFQQITGSDYLDLEVADYLKASMKHWLLASASSSTALSGTLGAQAGPALGSGATIRSHQVCYAYTGQPNYSTQGTMKLPHRVTEDGTAYVRDVSSSTVTVRNTWGNPTSITNWQDSVAYATTLTYDGTGRILQKVVGPQGELVRGLKYDGSNPYLVREITNALNEVTQIDYTGDTRVDKVTTASGQVTQNRYYSSGTYQGFLQGTEVTGVATNGFTYLNGNVYSATNALGLVTTNTWDDLNRLTSTVYPDGTWTSNVFYRLDVSDVKDRMGHWTHYTYNAVRQLTGITDDNYAQVASFTYCGCGSPDSLTRYNGTETLTTTLQHNLDGQVGQVLFPDYYAVNYAYNSAGRLTSVEDSGGYRTTPVYGDNERVVESRLGPDNSPLTALRRAFDVYGRVTHLTNANNVVTTNGYDFLHRTVLQHLVGGADQTFEYTARGLTNATDELGHITRYVKDALGRTTSLTNANNEALTFTYNPLGQRLTLKDGKDQVTTWKYDAYGRVTNKVDQAGREIFRYRYDADGRLTNRWTAEKGDTFYLYDNLGRIKNVDYPGTGMDIALQYDGLGRLTNAVDAIGETKFTYTTAGELATEDGPWASDTMTYAYQYRRRTSASLEQPSGTWTQSYLYDGYGRLTNVNSSAGDFGYRYDPQRSTRIAQLSLPNGHYITNTYDSLARLTQSTLVTAGGAVRNAHGYQLNVGHQRTNQVFTNATLSLAGERMGYSYDNIGQLKTAKGKLADGSTDWSGKQFGYAYDAAWNLNTRTNNGTVEPFTVDSLNQLTNTANPSEFVYDLNGNLRTNGTQVLEYDYENQLTSVQVAGSWRTEFKYDFQGRLRVRKEYAWTSGLWSLSSEVRYLYDGMLVIQERDGSDDPQVSYTRGQDLGGGFQGAGGIGGLLARTQHSGTDAGTGYYHSDGNGNVTTILAPDGNSLLAAYLYDPYGRTLESSGVWASANVYRFSSKEHHAASGLYYYGYRFYSPDLQRWVNRDPIQEAGGINLYGFVGNKVGNRIDPFGHDNLNCSNPSCGSVQNAPPDLTSTIGPCGPEVSYGDPLNDP